MKVKVDGKEVEVSQNATVKDVVKDETHLVVIVRKIKDYEKHFDTFKLRIGKESLTLKIENWELWKAIEDKLCGVEMVWRTKRLLAFGPFTCNLKCSQIQHEYGPGEVILTFAGGSTESAYLIFTITRYTLNHFTIGDGVIGRVIEGSKALRFLEIGEKIVKIEPMSAKEASTGIRIRATMDHQLMEGDEIYSRIMVNLLNSTPYASEYSMKVFEKNSLVEEVTNTYVRFKGIKGVGINEENNEKRLRGSVTVRRNGKNAGSVYIYLRDRMPHKDHCIVGFVNNGLELLDVAKKGDRIRIITNPTRIDVVGLTQKEAGELLAKNGLRHIREGDIDDNAIVVSQFPETTFEVVSKREVVTFGVESNKIVKVRIFDELAPKTALYFRIVTGLISKKVGKIPVYFKTKDLVIFKPSVPFEEPLIPENMPRDLVKAGEIGVTNMSRKHAGLIGVRFSDSREFGPTAERFESTNLVGKVVENFEVIKDSKEGSEVYIMEVQ